tara:strand:- start:663 stop:1805 length:1143 start_codon:yes stop_codon:yes gene_type:complete
MIKNIHLRPDILFVVNDFEFFKTHRLGLIEFLKEKGKSIAVVTDLKNASTFDLKRMDDNNIVLINFNFDRASINPILNSYYLFKLFRLLLKINPKKLSLISAKPAVLGGLCSLFLRFETVFISITGLGYAFISTSTKARIIRKIIFGIYRIIFIKNNIRVIFQNVDDEEEFIREGLVNKNKSIIIKGNGIDTNLYRRNNYPKKLTFLFASRLLIDKGIREFIESSEKINSDNVEFKVAGEIDSINPNSLSEDEFSNLKKSENIQYLGRVEYEKMPELFNSSSVFVLPSYREGLPQVALEAASCGMPLILNNVTGCKDCVIENENGFLTTKGDTLDLINKMNRFIQDPSLIQSMGNSSRDLIIKNFSKELIYKQFLDLYEN